VIPGGVPTEGTLMTTTDVDAARSLHVEEIDSEQLEYALGPLDAAARWLAAEGIEQWPLSFTESPERAGWLGEQADKGNVFVWFALGMSPVGTLTLTDWQDPDFADGWAHLANRRGPLSVPTDDPFAQYVARFAVPPLGRRLFDGTLGTRMLDYAATIAEVRGASVLRLDCSKTNERLHRYYFEHGFEHVATVEVPGRKSGALFEKRLR
jgi:GNAT superfamily N-acetyltransferase